METPPLAPPPVDPPAADPPPAPDAPAVEGPAKTKKRTVGTNDGPTGRARRAAPAE